MRSTIESSWREEMRDNPLLSKQSSNELQISKQIFYSGAANTVRLFREGDCRPSGSPEASALISLVQEHRSVTAYNHPTTGPTRDAWIRYRDTRLKDLNPLMTVEAEALFYSGAHASFGSLAGTIKATQYDSEQEQEAALRAKMKTLCDELFVLYPTKSRNIQ